MPVLSVPVGNPVRLPDVEVRSVDAPTFAVLGKTVRVPFTIESSLPRDYVTTVTLKASNGEQVSKEVRIAAMGVTEDWMAWKPTALGDVTLTLDVPPHHDETQTDNNHMSVPVSVRQEKLRVLIVESYPRWEYRYLRNALSRDPGVELSCLLYHPGLGKTGGGNKDYIKQFPAGLDELSRYDVVFLGDVGVGNGQLTEEQCGWLKGIVEHQASGIVFMPGSHGLEASLLKTDLDALYPVVLDDTRPDGWGSTIPCHFVLTELGRHSLLTKLADNEEENMEIWEGLPGFQWYAAGAAAKGPASKCWPCTKMAKTSTAEFRCWPRELSPSGRSSSWAPTKLPSAGGKGLEDKIPLSFLGPGRALDGLIAAIWLARAKRCGFYYAPDQPLLDRTLTLNANVMNPSGEPLQGGDVSARVTAPSGKAENVGFVSSGEAWGAYAAQFTAHEPGKHQVVLTCKQTGATLETSFFVQGTATERTGLPARPEVLEEIARATRGKVMRVDHPEEIVSSLASLPEPAASVRRMQLWSHPLTAALVITLMGIFWIARKAVGLI